MRTSYRKLRSNHNKIDPHSSQGRSTAKINRPTWCRAASSERARSAGRPPQHVGLGGGCGGTRSRRGGGAGVALACRAGGGGSALRRAAASARGHVKAACSCCLAARGFITGRCKPAAAASHLISLSLGAFIGETIRRSVLWKLSGKPSGCSRAQNTTESNPVSSEAGSLLSW